MDKPVLLVYTLFLQLVTVSSILKTSQVFSWVCYLLCLLLWSPDFQSLAPSSSGSQPSSTPDQKNRHQQRPQQQNGGGRHQRSMSEAQIKREQAKQKKFEMLLNSPPKNLLGKTLVVFLTYSHLHFMLQSKMWYDWFKYQLEGCHLSYYYTTL